MTDEDIFGLDERPPFIVLANNAGIMMTPPLEAYVDYNIPFDLTSKSRREFTFEMIDEMIKTTKHYWDVKKTFVDATSELAGNVFESMDRITSSRYWDIQYHQTNTLGKIKMLGIKLYKSIRKKIVDLINPTMVFGTFREGPFWVDQYETPDNIRDLE